MGQSINEVTQLLPDGGNKIIDIEIVYRPGVFGNSLGITATGVYYITSEALRGCLKSRLGSKKAHQCKLRICSTQHRESVMSKAYPSNLTRAQYELLSEMIPKAKPGGRPREVDMWEILNAIFYVEGVRWRSLPGDFPAWQTVYTYFRTWRKDETWLQLHDRLRDWTRIEQERHRSRKQSSTVKVSRVRW